jgi:hypothetical protein
VLQASLMLRLGLAGILFSSGEIAPAEQHKIPTLGKNEKRLALSFDLARACGGEPECRSSFALHPHRIANSQATPPPLRSGASEEESLGPMMRYQPYSRGPSIEIAAFGAGRKTAPRIVHLALNWGF